MCGSATERETILQTAKEKFSEARVSLTASRGAESHSRPIGCTWSMIFSAITSGKCFHFPGIFRVITFVMVFFPSSRLKISSRESIFSRFTRSTDAFPRALRDPQVYFFFEGNFFLDRLKAQKFGKTNKSSKYHWKFTFGTVPRFSLQFPLSPKKIPTLTIFFPLDWENF